MLTCVYVCTILMAFLRHVQIYILSLSLSLSLSLCVTLCKGVSNPFMESSRGSLYKVPARKDCSAVRCFASCQITHDLIRNRSACTSVLLRLLLYYCVNNHGARYARYK